ncbi:MAG TPA: STAS domain-containing protein [Candidatus Hydrogenedentes bacterium]|nr:STAS domain-containing protein [Candidatus Hydrogenedentota bacterium]HOV73069.1 STAS domain-containing protein [Candidatus Hydrogenedentota bacterium]HPC16169.1 STAS domain-containing protein [Candidatus Hydrogenedentota bacterium]HRT18619.1 STAS domain-containing protein [Candidatus Hydrogenedentota bacterium]HRT63639.1 STAS domain-containing protein [Candidatus Hydrogenedentota bacterium]
MIHIERCDMGPVVVLRIEGDIDDDGVKALRLSFLGCLKEKRCKVVANLSGVRHISFMGLGVLVERLRHLRLGGGDLKLVGVNMYADRVFRMAGVSALFDIHETESQAIQQFREAA